MLTLILLRYFQSTRKRVALLRVVIVVAAPKAGQTSVESVRSAP